MSTFELLSWLGLAFLLCLVLFLFCLALVTLIFRKWSREKQGIVAFVFALIVLLCLWLASSGQL